MSSTRDIQVSTDVYAALWAARKPGEDSEDAILRRVLAVPTEASQPNDKPTASPPMLTDAGNAVENLLVFPPVESRAKPANTEQPSKALIEPVPTLQRRLELLADKLGDPFRLVF
jgi:hypothetical protein